MKNQDLNDQVAFEMVLKLITERAGNLLVSGETLKQYVQSGLIYEQMLAEAKQLNDLVDYLVKKLNVTVPSSYEKL